MSDLERAAYDALQLITELNIGYSSASDSHQFPERIALVNRTHNLAVRLRAELEHAIALDKETKYDA